MDNVLVKLDRPRVLGGLTIKVSTGCGNMYIQLNWYKGKLLETFATHGHGGGCAACEMEALTKSITLGLKCGIPVVYYIDQLKGISCPSLMPFPKEDAVSSCPDAIAKTLEQYGTLPVNEIVRIILDMNGDVVSPEEETAGAKAIMQTLADERERQGLNA